VDVELRPRLRLAPSSWKLAMLAAIGGTVAIAAWPTDWGVRTTPAVPSAPTQNSEPPADDARPPLAAEVEDAPAPIAPTPAPIAPAADSSRREIEQLVRVRALLESDPAAAYRLAQRSEQEFPNGVLSEERQALQVLALAKSGASEDARRKARAFFRRYPESPMRGLLEQALAQ
jgi:hypothetical protein